ncbi:MAG TPA: hypothetical protein ENF26_07525 [Methanomicrobia archaeon]|nr:hypothetical protein [Methanomicrobia archaeon]HEX59978.1 hypothetical protein [Methanomicrobia archaeon]
MTQRLSEICGGAAVTTALYSAGVVVQATDKEKLGGRHAGRNYYWGGCCLNPTAIAIAYARAEGLATRFAIVDTDTHHADVTRELFMSDDAVLHVRYCWGWGRTETKTKVCLPHVDSDEEFIRRFGEEVPWRLEEFKPELIYRICGLDTHRDSYGTRKLTERCYRACEDKGAAKTFVKGGSS